MIIIFRLVQLRILKSKMTMVRIVTVSFGVLSQKKYDRICMCCLKLLPLRGKNISEHLSNEILVSLRVFFKKFPTSTLSLLYGCPPLGGGGGGSYVPFSVFPCAVFFKMATTQTQQ